MGFSAHTGDVADEHDIISIATHNVVWHPPVPGASAKRGSKKYTSRDRSRNGGGGFGSWLFAMIKWLFFAVVIVVAFIVFRGYQTKKSAKRF
jgi:mannose-binding lectin 2